MNFEEMASQLAAHPDYKVKRRLVPILNFGSDTGGPSKRILVLDTETTGLDWRAEKSLNWPCWLWISTCKLVYP